MALRLDQAGADGLVLFNRFLHPDVDPERLTVAPGVVLSRPEDARLPRSWIAILHGHVAGSLAATTGVERAEDVAAYLLAGADVVMTASALLRHGVRYASTLVAGLENWMVRKGFESLDEVRGRLAVPPTRTPRPTSVPATSPLSNADGRPTRRSASAEPRGGATGSRRPEYGPPRTASGARRSGGRTPSPAAYGIFRMPLGLVALGRSVVPWPGLRQSRRGWMVGGVWVGLPTSIGPRLDRRRLSVPLAADLDDAPAPLERERAQLAVGVDGDGGPTRSSIGRSLIESL